jgi:uncharacterized protein YhjY with autotransporter beta-barrel domain
MFHPTRFCLSLLFCLVTEFIPKAAKATGSIPIDAQPNDFTQLLNLNIAATQQIFQEDRVIAFGEIPRPGLANAHGLSPNERAIALSLDKIDERILRRGYSYLEGPLFQIFNYERALADYKNELRTLFNHVFSEKTFNEYLSLLEQGPPAFPSKASGALNSDAYLFAAYGRKDAGVLSQTLQLSGSLNEALDRLSPEQLVVMQSLALSFANEQSLALEERLAQIRADVTGTAEPAYMGKDGKATQAPVAHERWGAFVDGSGDFVDVGSTAQARGYSFNQGTVTLGAYYEFSPSFIAGITVSYAGADASLEADNGRVDADSMEASLFGTWTHGGWHVDAIVGGGYNSYDIDTHFGVEFDGGHIKPLPVHASTDGGFGDVLLGTGYDLHLGRLVFGPTFSAEYAHATINSFSEDAADSPPTGSITEFASLSKHGADKLVNPVLKVEPKDADSLKTTLGWGISLPLDIGKMKLAPMVNASWQHECLDEQYAINAAFPFALNDRFTVRGPAMGRDLLLLQAGATLRVNDRISIYASYEGMLARQNYSGNVVEGGGRIAF